MVQDQERRSFHRFPFEGQGLVGVGNVHRVQCRVIDISINGALLELEEPVEFGPGSCGDLWLILRGHIRSSRIDLEFSIEVVWQNARVLGCRFIRVDPDTFEQLKIFVADNLGDPALLDRELTRLGYWPGVDPSSAA